MSPSGEKAAECDWGPEQASQGKGYLVLHALDGVKGYLEEIRGTSIPGTEAGERHQIQREQLSASMYSVGNSQHCVGVGVSVPVGRGTLGPV